MERVINSVTELRQLAQNFVETFPRGSIVGLSGPLGSGKTAFVRECIQFISGEINPIRVASPSFVIHQSYRQLSVPIEHFDLYRLEKLSPQDLSEIGYFDSVEFTLANEGFLFLEWPENVFEKASLRMGIEIKILLLSNGGRKFLIETVR